MNKPRMSFFTLIFLTIVLSSPAIFTMAVIEGKVNYSIAVDIVMRQSSDSERENKDTLYKYGFNTKWNQKPTTTDYFLSPFRKQLRKH